MSRSPFRIFAADHPVGSGPPRPILQATAAAAPQLVAADLPPGTRDVVQAEVVRILDESPEPGESVQRAFDRKERQLVAYLATLDVELRARVALRLNAGITSDVLVERISRLTAERRARITAVANDLRRRP